jgi:predicted GTPase
VNFRGEVEHVLEAIRIAFCRFDALKMSVWDAVTAHADIIPPALVNDFHMVEKTYAGVKKSTLSVLFAGVSKAGKSSTANAVIEQDEFFLTGAVRKTDRISKKVWNGISIVDTPGIDSIEDVRDEAMLLRELQLADLVVFLFSDKEGDLDAVTQAFLRDHLLAVKDVLYVINKKRDD